MAFLVGALVSFALAIYLYFAPAPSVDPRLLVAQTDFEVADCKAGKETAIVIPVQNASRNPVRVLSIVPSCGQNACCGPKRSEESFDLPPGSSNLECWVKASQSGPFSTRLTVYVDDDGVREILITLHGTAVASKPKQTSNSEKRSTTKDAKPK